MVQKTHFYIFWSWTIFPTSFLASPTLINLCMVLMTAATRQNLCSYSGSYSANILSSYVVLIFMAPSWSHTVIVQQQYAMYL